MQHIYLSYPRSEYELAHRLVDDLQAAGYAVFIDAVSEPGSLAWSAETRRAIRASGAMVMILGARWRRIGIRHEGVLARRGRKPVFVLRRGSGPLPRYLRDAPVLDCSEPYESVRDRLLAALPPAGQLAAETLPIRRQQRLRRQAARRRWIAWAGWAALAIALSAAVVLVFGWITG